MQKSFFAPYFVHSNEYRVTDMGVRTELIRKPASKPIKDYPEDVLLVCRTTYGGKYDDVIFFDRERLEKIHVLEARRPGRVDASFFTGEIGERVMRTRLYAWLKTLSERDPGFQYKILTGTEGNTLYFSMGKESRKAKLSHVELAYGPIGNVLVHKIKMKTTKSRAGNYKTKEFRDQKLLGEIDTLIGFTYNGEPGYIVCEAKTGEIDSDISEQALNNQLRHVNFLFPEFDTVYLLMGTRDEMVGKDGLYNELIKVVDHNIRADEYKTLFFPFDISGVSLDDCGEYMHSLLQEEIKSGYSPVFGRRHKNHIKLRNQTPDRGHGIELTKLGGKLGGDELKKLLKNGSLWMELSD